MRLGLGWRVGLLLSCILFQCFCVSPFPCCHVSLFVSCTVCFRIPCFHASLFVSVATLTVSLFPYILVFCLPVMFQFPASLFLLSYVPVSCYLCFFCFFLFPSSPFLVFYGSLRSVFYVSLLSVSLSPCSSFCFLVFFPSASPFPCFFTFPSFHDLRFRCVLVFLYPRSPPSPVPFSLVCYVPVSLFVSPLLC